MRNLFFTFLLCFLFVPVSNAQFSEIEDFFGKSQESVSSHDENKAVAKDSIRIAELEKQIGQMESNEILYRELLKTYLSDSLRQAIRKITTPSFHKSAQGAPLIVNGDTLFMYYEACEEATAPERAANAAKAINSLVKTKDAVQDSIRLHYLENDRRYDIMYLRKVLTSVTGNDALRMNMSLDSLANMQRESIVAALKSMKTQNSFTQVFKRIGLFLLVLAINILVFYFINLFYRKMKLRIKTNRQKWFKPIVFSNYELLNANRQANLAAMLINLFRYLLILIQLLIFFPLLFSVFPQTKPLASKLIGYIVDPVKHIFYAIIHYIPNLFTIVIILLLIRYLIKGIAYIAKEVQNEKLKIPGFYTEWAMPTYYIAKFLLYAFMIAMIFPLLPGAETGTFKGISIFVGLIVSLGSSSAISNILAGLIMTYMRSFKAGDFIKLNETEGNVIEKTSFVTRIKTTKNEIVTIPNSFVLSSPTTNYSASARDYGLIIHTNVAIGYEVPWQKAHEYLIRAAKRTRGVLPHREPFVLDLGLEDYYNHYEINAYILDADHIPTIITELNSNILSVLTEEGVELESPLLMSQRKEPAKKWS
ncbi:MAG: mechanosensitive ion channel family protein [Bacteroidales bacterium]|jgi:small-conductance mechanosensitive channel|nr:mechanosensitive ion channel family protein [Bacteroidales bacterium]